MIGRTHSQQMRSLSSSVLLLVQWKTETMLYNHDQCKGNPENPSDHPPPPLKKSVVRPGGVHLWESYLVVFSYSLYMHTRVHAVLCIVT